MTLHQTIKGTIGQKIAVQFLIHLQYYKFGPLDNNCFEGRNQPVTACDVFISSFISRKLTNKRWANSWTSWLALPDHHITNPGSTQYFLAVPFTFFYSLCPHILPISSITINLLLRLRPMRICWLNLSICPTKRPSIFTWIGYTLVQHLSTLGLHYNLKTVW